MGQGRGSWAAERGGGGPALLSTLWAREGALGGLDGLEKKEGFSIFGLSTKECHKMDSKRGFRKGTK